MRLLNFMILLLAAAAWCGDDAKLPIPDAAGLKTAETLVHEVFGDDFKKTAPADRVALAEKLFQNAAETKDDPATRYFLLNEAVNQAALGGDIRLTVRALQRQSDEYDIDPVAVREKALERVAPLLRTPSSQAELAEAYLKLADLAFDADKHDAALNALSRADQAGKRSASVALVSRIKARTEEVRAAKDAYQLVLAAEKNAPPLAGVENTAAFAEKGKYLATCKNDWDAALPLLAKGNDPAWADAASAEIAAQRDGAKLAAAADLWWGIGEVETKRTLKAAVTERATALYRQALPWVSGLAKAKIEKRISGAPTATSSSVKGGKIDLLRLIDTSRDTVAGTWKLENGKLIGNAGYKARLQLPYKAPEEYDFRIVFTRKSGDEGIYQIATAPHSVMWGINGWKSRYFGFEDTDGKEGNTDSTVMVTPETKATVNTTHESVLKVRKDRIECWFDRKLLLSWDKGLSRLSTHGDWNLKDKTLLGVGNFQSDVEFSAIEVIEVTGRGTVITDLKADSRTMPKR